MASAPSPLPPLNNPLVQAGLNAVQPFAQWLSTLDAAIRSLVKAVVAGQLPATATNDNASAGNLGEYITTSLASGVALSNNTVANITSITLSAGDWDISGIATLTVGAAATATFFEAIICNTSASFASPTESGTAAVLQVSMGNNFVEQIALPTVRASLSASTTLYLNVEATITAASNGGGRLRARRVR